MAEAKTDKCASCEREIEVGQHFMRLRIEPDTKMLVDWQPARHVEPTVLEAVFDLPSCAARWIIVHPTLVNIFAH